jgi:hypothetical protein
LSTWAEGLTHVARDLRGARLLARIECFQLANFPVRSGAQSLEEEYEAVVQNQAVAVAASADPSSDPGLFPINLGGVWSWSRDDQDPEDAAFDYPRTGLKFLCLFTQSLELNRSNF